jgi:hypothetical protein
MKFKVGDLITHKDTIKGKRLVLKVTRIQSHTTVLTFMSPWKSFDGSEFTTGETWEAMHGVLDKYYKLIKFNRKNYHPEWL